MIHLMPYRNPHRFYMHLAVPYILRWSLKHSGKRTWTGSAFSTNESAWSVMVTGLGLVRGSGRKVCRSSILRHVSMMCSMLAKHSSKDVKECALSIRHAPNAILNSIQLPIGHEVKAFLTHGPKINIGSIYLFSLDTRYLSTKLHCNQFWSEVVEVLGMHVLCWLFLIGCLELGEKWQSLYLKMNTQKTRVMMQLDHVHHSRFNKRGVVLIQKDLRIFTLATYKFSIFIWYEKNYVCDL